MKIYTIEQIQTVYARHHNHCGTVVYSEDGYIWTSVPIDSGKWDIIKWKFAFIELKKK